MMDNQNATARSAESGFSLIEIVVAMLVLALMAIGVLPLIIGTVQTGVSNRSQVAATTFANAQLAELRAAFGNDSLRPCSELIDTTKPDPDAPYLRIGFADPAGSGLTADRTAPGLNPDDPGQLCEGDTYKTVTIKVVVHPAGDADTDLVKLTSEILVSTT